MSKTSEGEGKSADTDELKDARTGSPTAQRHSFVTYRGWDGKERNWKCKTFWKCRL